MSDDVNGDGLTYKEWERRVNTECYKLSEGMFGMWDMVDWASWDAWDGDMSPRDGALECLGNDGIGRQVLELMEGDNDDYV